MGIDPYVGQNAAEKRLRPLPGVRRDTHPTCAWCELEHSE
jgi:hypothetical protein